MAKGKGIPCGASYINKDKKCRVGVPSAVANVLNRASEEVGAKSLIAAAGAHGGHGAKRKAEHVAAVLRNKLKGNIVRGDKGRALKRALEAKGLLPVEAPVMRAGDIFNKNVVPAKPAPKGVPSDLKKQLNAIAAVDQEVPAKGPRTQRVDDLVAQGLNRSGAERVVAIAEAFENDKPVGSLTEAKRDLSNIQAAGVAAAVRGRQTSFARNVDKQEVARAKIEEIAARQDWEVVVRGGAKDKINAAVERHEKAVEKLDKLEAQAAARKPAGYLTRAKKEEADAIAAHRDLLKERVALARVKTPEAKARKKELDKQLLAGMKRIEDAKEDVAAQGGVAKTDATGNTKWARSDAGDFDNDFKIYKKVRGTADMINWDDTVRQGTKIGEGAYGTVMMDKAGNYVVKRGRVTEEEAKIIKKVGEAGLGPKLIVGEADSKGNGRIAMDVAPGEPIGNRAPDDKIGGVRVVDAYWKSRAALHRMGIAHNDMHIDNVFVDDKGKGHLLDMGLAQDSPKAALAEAMGAFNPPRGAKPVSIPGAKGEADWQVRRWSGTGGMMLERVNGGRASQMDRDELARRAPVLRTVMDNKLAAFGAMRRDGFTDNEIATVMETGIRTPLEVYETGPWGKMTPQQAQNYINILYEGV